MPESEKLTALDRLRHSVDVCCFKFHHTALQGTSIHIYGKMLQEEKIYEVSIHKSEGKLHTSRMSFVRQDPWI